MGASKTRKRKEIGFPVLSKEKRPKQGEGRMGSKLGCLKERPLPSGPNPQISRNAAKEKERRGVDSL